MRETRAVTEEEWPAFVRATNTAFGNVPSEEDCQADRRLYPLDRTIAAFEDGGIIGTAGAFPFETTVPGGIAVPTAGVTWVSVLPTHTRRGVLTGMMRHQLDDVRQRGEPLATLLASESLIYGRFGYGLATTQHDYAIDRRHAQLNQRWEQPGTVELLDDDTARKVCFELHSRAAARQPGDSPRDEAFWTDFLRRSPRGGQWGPRFLAAYRSPEGSWEGFAAYRVKGDMGAWEVLVQLLVALDVDAYVALWRYVTDIDLSQTVLLPNRPPDEPVQLMLRDPRRLESKRVSDFLWCRLVDLPAALSARRYATADRLVVQVTDAFCGWNDGRWAIEGSPDGAACSPTKEAADLTLTVNELGSLYFGGVSATALARARRIDEETPGALARADLFFSSQPAPWASTGF